MNGGLEHSFTTWPWARTRARTAVRMGWKQPVEGGVDGELRAAHGSIHPHIGDSRSDRSGHEKHIATQTSTRDRSFGFPDRRGVRVRLQNTLQWKSNDAETQAMVRPGRQSSSTSPPG